MRIIGNGVSYHGDTLDVMDILIKENTKIDFVLTSPPYNMRNHEKYMYNNTKTFKDNKSNEEYQDWIVSLFHKYEKLLNKNGVVLLNLNYISSLKNKAINLFKIIVEIEEKTGFTLIDQICWKKDNAMPIPEARLSRIWENIWVFIRNDDWVTFRAKHRSKMQGKHNYIYAPNNDFSNNINKACFSSSMVEQLLNLYDVKKNDIILDNFMGTHTTAIGCEKIGCKWIGIELDEDTYKHGIDRVNDYIGEYIDRETTQIDIFNYE